MKKLITLFAVMACASGFGANLGSYNLNTDVADMIDDAANYGSVSNAALAVYNVKNYGAVGDGATSDVDAIDSAIQAAETNGGGIIYFPPGTYAIGNESARPTYTSLETGLEANICIASNNIHLVGSGMGTTVLKRVGGDNGRNLFNSQYTTNGSIRDMTIDMSTNLVYDGTSFEYLANWHIINTEWKNHVSNNSGGDCLEFSEGTEIYITGCRFENIAANALALDGSGTMYAHASDLYFENCGFNSPTNYTIASHYEGNWAAFQMRQGNFNLSNITAIDCPTFIQFLGNVLNISNARLIGDDTASTNNYFGSGLVSMNNVEISSVASAGVCLYAAPLKKMDNSGFEGSGAIMRMNNVNTETIGVGAVLSNRFQIANSSLSSATPNHTVIVKAGDNSEITGSRLVNNGASTLRVQGAISECLFSGNVLGTINFEAGASSSTKNIFNGNITENGSFQTGGTASLYTANVFIGAFDVNSGTAPSWAVNNIFYDLDINSSQAWVFRGNTVDLADIAASEEQKNTIFWLENKTFDNEPLTGVAAKTVNYTASGLDDLLVFNNSGLTNTLPDAARPAFVDGKLLTVKNINAGALIVDGDGADTIEGNATISLDQYDSVTLRSDGTNWIIINKYDAAP